MEDETIKLILRRVHHIALVGASDRPERASYRVMAYLLEQGYRVTPVSPKLAGQTLLGQRVYATLADIADPIDMVDVFRNAEAAVSVAQEAIAVGAGVLWLQLGVISPQAQALAQAAGMQVVMDHCPKIDIPRLGIAREA
ncbi:CoA-binding protein [Edwardsiella piscicida]|uniref:CoA-binding protein n=1 Tax=Edwardsiella piscicida TaxID=1263550 RepID=UPI0002C0ED6A|nr:CoA-binding protein [Edwardsiella piscicida]AGH73336.1 succinyl-CoA synthetase subunit alpha [Edwardsiella piscicida C07-087]EKS7779023.1 CoA-binding protein [Edwardsiella piscicida]EKS7782443.1 CoA-binding protein [Edwardsiella piscicida]EKS7791859.1 CoA-binding protein [Edwardsiella piscicida]EKS7811972.1 CoA-binding protein [Edwardsiella piscicida]